MELIVIFSLTFLLISSFTICYSSQYQTLSWPEPEPESESTTSLSLPLSHIHDLYPSSNISREDLFNLSHQRDALRIKSLISLATGNVKRTHRGFSGSIASGSSQGIGEYFMRLGVGTPKENVNMVLDTGSDIIWLQCLPCKYCYNQSDPIFNPAKSKSYATVPCGSHLCHKLGSGCTPAYNKTCYYQINYGGGSSAFGDFSTETLTFHRARIDHIAFGCNHGFIGSFNSSAGIFGLGRGEFSFPSQTKSRYNGRFSYCLPARFSKGSSRSTIVFGNHSIPRNAIFTPLVTNPKRSTFYYMELLGISVDGSRVRGITKSQFEIDAVTGDGGLFIDSGTTITKLKHSVYVAFRDAFRSKMPNMKLVQMKPFDTCYDISKKAKIKVPSVVFHFSGGDVSLPMKNYLVKINDNGRFCFAFADSGRNFSVYGNIQQQNFRIAYDSIGSRIGFLPNAC